MPQPNIKDMADAIDHIAWTIKRSPTAYRQFRSQLKTLKSQINAAEKASANG